MHPLSFGMILGRSFSALRQNPKVLLGFAVVVQAIAYLLMTAAAGALMIWALTRLDTVPFGSPDWEAIFFGSMALVVLVSFALSLLVTSLSVIVQAVVVSEVAHAVVAEKLTLRRLWQRVKPVAWRLIGYTLLLNLAYLLLFAVIAGIITALAFTVPPLAIVIGFLLILGSIPLIVWLSTKLALVPSAIILEGITIRAGIARSWILVRGRFWPVFGVLIVINVIMGFAAQLVSVPFSLLGSGLTTVFAPTGASEVEFIIAAFITGLVTQVFTVLVQAVAVIVMATAAALLYIDARMRREGLDLDLLAYMDRRDAGAGDLPDPYRVHAGRVLARAPMAPPPTYMPPGAYPPPGTQYPPGSYPPSPAYPPGGTYPPRPPAPAPPTQPASPTQPAPPAPPAPAQPVPPAQPAPPTHPAPPAQPGPTTWAPPGAPDRDDP